MQARGKENKNTNSKPNENKKYFDRALGSKKKKKKFEKALCSYCMRGFHRQNSCMKKTINKMEKILEKHNISLPEGVKKTDSREETEYHDVRCHELKASCSKSHAFLIVSGASNHMVASRESFSSLQNTYSQIIHIGYDIQIRVEGNGSIKIKHGVFINILYVPSLAVNLH